MLGKRSVLCASVLLVASLTTADAQIPQGLHGPFGSGGGGAFYCPSFVPTAGGTLYVTSDMSGVYRTTNLGVHWSMLGWQQLQGSSRTGRIQPTSNPSILYTLNGANDAAVPSKSTDGGVTWSPLASDPTSGGAYALFSDPTTTSRIIVSDYSTIHVSTNGGTSFSSVFTSNVNGAGCHVAGVIFDSAAILIGTNAGLLASTNGGISFTPVPVGGIPSTESMVSFCGARSGTQMRLYCVTLGTGDVYAGVTGGDHDGYRGVYTLAWGQSAWTPATNGIDPADHPFFTATARTTPATAYLAGGSSGGTPVVYKTTDGGSLWSRVFLTPSNQNIVTGWSGDGGDRGWSYGEYALGLAVAPDNVNRVAITDLGCVHVTINGGMTWNQAYTDTTYQHPAGAQTPPGRIYRSSGLENTSAWWVGFAADSSLFLAATDIRGMLSTDHGASWSFNYTGHTLNTMYHILTHPVSGVHYASTSSIHDLYQSTYLTDAKIDGGTGRILFATGGFSNWQTLHDFNHPVTCTAADPTNPNRLFAAVVHSTLGGIYVTNDLQNGPASAWTRLPNPPRTQGHPYSVQVLDDGTVLAVFSGRRAGSPLAFTPSSGVFISTDHGATWIDRSAAGLWYWTKDVLVDRTDPSRNTWFAGVFSGWGGAPNGLGGLYRTTNRGVSWTRIFTSSGVESCQLSCNMPGEMHVLTEAEGLVYTADCHAAAPAFVPDTMPFKHPVRMFCDPYQFGVRWITTFGGGLYFIYDTFIPVEMRSFTAHVEEGRVRLDWSTESENGNTGFDIQRRDPLEAGWRTIGFVSGHGTTTRMSAYTFFDEAPTAGRLAYRLLQRDADGAQNPSDVVYVQVEGSVVVALRVAEGLVRDRATVSWRTDADGIASLAVYDLLGRLLRTAHEGWTPAGAHTTSIDCTGLASGSYLLILRGPGTVHIRRMLHLR